MRITGFLPTLMIIALSARVNEYTTVIVEYSPDGEKVREIPLEGRGFPVSSVQQSQRHSSRPPEFSNKKGSKAKGEQV